MKCQTCFLGKIKKNIISVSSAEFAHSMLSVKKVFGVQDSKHDVTKVVSLVKIRVKICSCSNVRFQYNVLPGCLEGCVVIISEMLSSFKTVVIFSPDPLSAFFMSVRSVQYRSSRSSVSVMKASARWC